MIKGLKLFILGISILILLSIPTGASSAFNDTMTTIQTIRKVEVHKKVIVYVSTSITTSEFRTQLEKAGFKQLVEDKVSLMLALDPDTTLNPLTDFDWNIEVDQIALDTIAIYPKLAMNTSTTRSEKEVFELIDEYGANVQLNLLKVIDSITGATVIRWHIH